MKNETEATQKSNRGGSRPGAGRPKMDVVRINVTILNDQLEWLKARGDVSKQLREMIDEKREKEN